MLRRELPVPHVVASHELSKSYIVFYQYDILLNHLLFLHATIPITVQSD